MFFFFCTSFYVYWPYLANCFILNDTILNNCQVISVYSGKQVLDNGKTKSPNTIQVTEQFMHTAMLSSYFVRSYRRLEPSVGFVVYLLRFVACFTRELFTYLLILHFLFLSSVKLPCLAKNEMV